MSKRPTLTKALSYPNYVLTSFWKEKNLERKDLSQDVWSPLPPLLGDWIEQQGLCGVMVWYGVVV